jgi:hypothetical protein
MAYYLFEFVGGDEAKRSALRDGATRCLRLAVPRRVVA